MSRPDHATVAGVTVIGVLVAPPEEVCAIVKLKRRVWLVVTSVADRIAICVGALVFARNDRLSSAFRLLRFLSRSFAWR